MRPDPRTSALAKLAARQADEIRDLLDLLRQYGDHTYECYADRWAARCKCGWDRERRRLGIPGRD